MVGSQTASLTPDPSFAHNLGDRCPNGQCEAIIDIYASRTFQWHQEHPNARCFGSCCRALNIRESRRTSNPHFFQVLGFTPTLGQSRVATLSLVRKRHFDGQYSFKRVLLQSWEATTEVGMATWRPLDLLARIGLRTITIALSLPLRLNGYTAASLGRARLPFRGACSPPCTFSIFLMIDGAVASFPVRGSLLIYLKEKWMNS